MSATKHGCRQRRITLQGSNPSQCSINNDGPLQTMDTQIDIAEGIRAALRHPLELNPGISASTTRISFLQARNLRLRHDSLFHPRSSCRPRPRRLGPGHHPKLWHTDR